MLKDRLRARQAAFGRIIATANKATIPLNEACRPSALIHIGVNLKARTINSTCCPLLGGSPLKHQRLR